ncbi:unnamed protein product [Caenorhabditis angaria]|uniref:Tetraspanin n=1 Tax=Caenorhabditis angaria TaxID=860376 RepID=A0A9P1N9B4_9PELO|nr:unnamed protein product [Caenorhabditis angaria]
MRGESDEYGISWRRDEYEKSQNSTLRRFLGPSSFSSSSTPSTYHFHDGNHFEKKKNKKDKDEEKMEQKKEKRRAGGGEKEKEEAKQHNNHAHVVSYNYSAFPLASGTSGRGYPENQRFLTEIRNFEDSRKRQKRKMGRCADTLRSLVFFFNFLFWISGIIILGLGIWIFLDPAVSDYYAVHSSHPGSFRTVGWLLIAAGAIMTFIGCFGCCGAYKFNQCALLGFFFILVIVFFLELAAAVTAYNKQENIRSYVESSMQDTIRNRYSSDENYRLAFDTIQTEFQCCGARGYNDWLQASWEGRSTIDLEENEEDLGAGRIEHGIGATGGFSKSGYGKVPASCCNEVGLATYPTDCGISFNKAPLHSYKNFLNTQGCANALFEKIHNHLDIIITVCVAIGALQLLGMIFTMALCCCVNNDNKKYNS